MVNLRGEINAVQYGDGKGMFNTVKYGNGKYNT